MLLLWAFVQIEHVPQQKAMLTMPTHQHNRTQRGATLIEYALLVALIAVIIIAVTTLISPSPDTRTEQRIAQQLETKFQLDASSIELQAGDQYMAVMVGSGLCVGTYRGEASQTELREAPNCTAKQDSGRD